MSTNSYGAISYIKLSGRVYSTQTSVPYCGLDLFPWHLQFFHFEIYPCTHITSLMLANWYTFAIKRFLCLNIETNRLCFASGRQKCCPQIEAICWHNRDSFDENGHRTNARYISQDRDLLFPTPASPTSKILSWLSISAPEYGAKSDIGGSRLETVDTTAMPKKQKWVDWNSR